MNKKLNTGEPIAFMNATGSCLSVEAIKSIGGVLGFDVPLYHRDYVNQMLRKIEALEKQAEYHRWKIEALEKQAEYHRWKIDECGDDLLICRNEHERGEDCEYVRYTVAGPLTIEGELQAKIEASEEKPHNANKILDELESSNFYDNPDPRLNDLIDETVSYIRQQKAEIKALRHDVGTLRYTHPVKELTNEEMYDLLEKYQGIELCKAVLRKAGKK